jgi:long-chain acyl-CoA synthetase
VAEILGRVIMTDFSNPPWLKFYGSVSNSLEYPQITLYECLKQSSNKYPDSIAWDFMGTTCTYRNFLKEVDQFSAALNALGFKKGDVITIGMPTAPQGIVPIYAVNKLGGICSVIHPLSPPNQIKTFLQISNSKWLMTLDLFYQQFKEGMAKTNVQKLILAGITDYLKGFTKLGFQIINGRKIPSIPADPQVLWMSDMMKQSYPAMEMQRMEPTECAIILYTGGTTGTPKGVQLSNSNMIAQGTQISAWGNLNHTQSVLAILPIFHVFGLGLCVNTAFMVGGKSILIPKFTPEEVARLVKKKRPTFLVGVPTLFETLAINLSFQKSDLSCLKATFSGADTLPRSTKEKFEAVVRAGGGDVQLLEGYGLTEASGAVIAMPLDKYREGSMGVPFPDMLAKIVKPGTEEELPVDIVGEICVSGPNVMLGYINQPEGNAQTLRKHSDGRIWLHTGDLASMDADGFFYFKSRLKRMLKVSGITVYPGQVEKTLQNHPAVDSVCVIGIPDRLQMSRVKAFIVLKDKTKATEETKQDILKFGRDNLLNWEAPRDLEFRDELPKTLIGKISFNELEKEANTRSETIEV